MNESTRTRLSLYVLVFAGIIWYLSQSVASPDLWGQIKFGLDAAMSSSLSHTDPYSYTNRTPHWLNDHWLNDIIFADVWRNSASAGLATLHLLLVGLIFGIVLWRFFKFQLPVSVAFLLAGVALLLTGQAGLNALSPKLFSYLLFVIELWVLQAGTKERYLGVSLPFIFVVWTYLDDGFLVGLAVLCLWALAHGVVAALRKEPAKASILYMAIALLAAVYLLAPQSWTMPHMSALLRLAFNTALNPPPLPEWHPLHAASPLGVVYLLLAAFAGWVIARKMLAEEPEAAAVLIFCLLLPFAALRYLPFATFAVLMLCGPSAAACLAPYIRPTDQPAESRRSQALRETLAWLGAAGLMAVSLTRLGTISMAADMPVGAVKSIKASGIGGNMAVYADWGVYSIFHLSPAVKVSLDNRWQTAYDNHAIEENLNFVSGIGEWDELLTKGTTSIVLSNKLTPNYGLMKLEPGWKLVYEDDVAAVFLPAASPDVQKFSTKPHSSEQSPSVFP
jgi:hypothetical protein